MNADSSVERPFVGNTSCDVSLAVLNVDRRIFHMGRVAPAGSLIRRDAVAGIEPRENRPSTSAHPVP
jgi:hypothetical protein